VYVNNLALALKAEPAARVGLDDAADEMRKHLIAHTHAVNHQLVFAHLYPDVHRGRCGNRSLGAARTVVR
jgi:hypothetical protein